MLSLPQSFTGPHISANWKVNLVVYQKQKHMLLSEVTWGFILIPLCLWKADEVEKWDKNRENRENIIFISLIPISTRVKGENGQPHVIISQRMSAGSRDKNFQLQDGMKWSSEILIHFSNDMTMCWTSYAYVKTGLLLLCLKRNQILFC